MDIPFSDETMKLYFQYE